MNSRWAILCFVLCLLPGTTEATVAEIYGFGARATAMGGAFTALADDFSAVYYNPAGLVMQRQPKNYFNKKAFRIEAGYQYARPELWVKRLDGQDLILQLPGFEAFPGGVIDPGAVQGLNVGVVFEPFDIGGLLPRKSFTLGMGLHMPIQRQYWTRPQIPGEIHFILHEDYSQRMLILMSVAYKVTENFAIGVGTSILFTMQTSLSGPLNLRLEALDVSRRVIEADRDDVFAGIDFDNKVDLAPIVGMLWMPKDFLHLGITYRGEQFLEESGVFDPILRFVLPDQPDDTLPGIAYGLSYEMVHFFTPHEVAIGLRVKPYNLLDILMDVTWMDWSKHPLRDPKFEDTIVPRLGIAYEAASTITLRFGYFWYPSPVQEQRWTTNDLDNDRHVFSAGLDFLYGPAIASCYFQYHHLVTREYRKLSADDFYGAGLEFGGNVYNVGLNLSVGF